MSIRCLSSGYKHRCLYFSIIDFSIANVLIRDDLPTSTPSATMSNAGMYMPQPSIRPRVISNPRPLSFHAPNTVGGVGPPLATSAGSNSQPAPYSPAPIGSYFSQENPFMPPTPSGLDYFGTGTQPISTRPFSSRFEAPPRRPSSGVGTRDPQWSPYDAVYYDYAYASASERTVVEKGKGTTSRPSRLRKSSAHEREGYQYMPPPPRPILRRPVTENTDENAPDDYEVGNTGGSENQISTGPPIVSRRPPSIHRNTVTYNLPDDRERSSEENRPSTIEVASSRRRNVGSRRKSYYGNPSEELSSTKNSAYEERIRAAAQYQEDVGGPNITLTAEVLKRQQRRQAGSSRTTRSSGSRDESDYTKSATTRTSRTSISGTKGSDDENVTIKVTGTARVVVGGVPIDCTDGGEIEIKRQRSIRDGSERSNSEYGAPTRGQQQIDGRDDQHTNLERQGGKIQRFACTIDNRCSVQNPCDDHRWL